MKQKGFTLIELLVSVAIFTIVMTIALGSLLSMSESDRKAQSFKSVINNLNFALESMSRTIRTGTAYGCGSGAGVDCPGGSSQITFSPAGGGSGMVYRLEQSDGALCGQTAAVGCIKRSTDGGVTFSSITSPEVLITNLTFYLIGSPQGNAVQPKVTILVSGEVTVTATQKSAFNLQTSVTQRLYDQ